MKKKFVLMVLTFLLTLTFVGPISAFALSEEISQPSEQAQLNGQSSVLSDRFIVYYKEIDGKTYYRIWNATDGRWETPWLPC